MAWKLKQGTLQFGSSEGHGGPIIGRGPFDIVSPPANNETWIKSTCWDTKTLECQTRIHEFVHKTLALKFVNFLG